MWQKEWEEDLEVSELAHSRLVCCFLFVTRFNGHKNNEKEAWEETFLELCDPPNHETAQPGLDVQEHVLERQVLIFTSYQAVAVIVLPKPLS